MVRLRTLHIATIAIFLMASYTIVYGTYFVCNTDLLSQSTSNHSHDEDHHADSSHQSKNTDDHSDTPSQDCCNELSLTFFNDAKLLVKQFKVDLTAVVIPVFTPTIFDYNFSLSKVVNFVRYIDPPPKAVHFQILFQSFLI